MSIAQLRRIDQEITGHRQQIARLQVEIARLEDARLVISALAERDQMGPGIVEPPLLAGSQGPLLVVRKAHSGVEEGPAPKQKHKRETIAPRSHKGVKRSDAVAQGKAFRAAIMELFRHQPVMTPRDVMDRLGLHDKRNMGRVYNGLLKLKNEGLLNQTQLGEPYTLPMHVNGGAAP
jgi:hypothetical protein